MVYWWVASCGWGSTSQTLRFWTFEHLQPHSLLSPCWLRPSTIPPIPHKSCLRHPQEASPSRWSQRHQSTGWGWKPPAGWLNDTVAWFRNPARQPPGMYKNLVNNGINYLRMYINWWSPDFFHQRYESAVFPRNKREECWLQGVNIRRCF